jgi:Zinc carboxypeptidase
MDHSLLRSLNPRQIKRIPARPVSIAQRFAIIIVVLLLAASAGAQQTRSPAVPSPRSVLGFSPGDDRTIADWRQISDYFARLDRASDRVLIQTIGKTTLQRPMIVAFISAPENIRDLAKYKDIQARLADPRRISNSNERDLLISQGKAVVVISCSIHSTEIVASQMSMQLAYELAHESDPETIEVLRNTILILVPSANPDGVDIVADWYRKTLGTPKEGSEPPELYHHYAGHDDNRDWFMLNLKETQHLMRLFWKEWFPQVVYDIHQQGTNGSRFFVPPFFDPPNPQVSPLLLREVGLMGHQIAANLQAAGFQGVITNALYDTWWHGGFRTAPYFHNSIGILTEAASARLMSPVTVTSDQLARSSSRGMPTALPAAPLTNFPDPWPGGVWRPRDIMGMELTASRSVLSLVAKYRERYLRNFYELGEVNASEKILAGQPLAYLIPAGQGHDENVAKMIGALVQQGVEVFRLDRELHATLGEQVIHRAKVLSPTKTAGSVPLEIMIASSSNPPEVPLGSYIVFLNQPYRRNVLALFEPQIYPNRLTATGEAERPYDVAGWTLPMQMGVDSLAVMSIREGAADRRLTLIRSENDVRRDFGLPLATGDRSPIASPVKAGVRTGIYKAARGNMDEGWTRYVFDTFNVPYTSLGEAALRDRDLTSRFDAIILPSDRRRAEADDVEAATGGLSANGLDGLRSFVEKGGTLICFDGSCDLVINHFKLPLKNVLAGRRSSEFYCPGSILRLQVDTSDPIARGMTKNVDAYFINSSAFEATDRDQVRVIARYAGEDLLRSGWLLGEAHLKEKIALAEVIMGKGRVILFGFRPQHRGQTWGTFPFIWNAISSR